MRFRGGGVGHKSTREATDFFKKDRDRLDKIDDEEDTEEIEDKDEPEDSGPDDDIEDDYGYAVVDSDSEESDEGRPDGVEIDDDEFFGPEDDGGGVDPDMDKLGYADL